MTVERSVRRLDEAPTAAPKPLAAFRSASAYVLLGDPGAGKTTAFQEEATAVGGRFITVRDFVTLAPGRHPDWGRVPLFVDALDEIRAGAGDARRPFDRARERLDALRPPAFRISCRDTDWLGESDLAHLRRAAPSGKVAVLRLEPLTRRQIEEIASGAPQAEGFFEAARSAGFAGLLGNPLNLALLLRAVADEEPWPESRREIFERVSATLAIERNEEHRTAEGDSASVPEVLRAAGLLSAVSLLADEAGTALPGRAPAGAPSVADLVGRRETATAALRSRLFAADSSGRFSPAHPQIGAFLAARYLSERIESIDEPLPVERALALLGGEDRRPPSPLRGLVSWLACLCRAARPALIRADPEAVLRFGDPTRFSNEEKSCLLDRLGASGAGVFAAARAEAPDGFLTPDIENEVLARLRDPGSLGRPAPDLELALRELHRAGPVSDELLDTTEEIVVTEGRGMRLRRAALDLLTLAERERRGGPRRLRRLLEGALEEGFGDPDQQLRGTLLRALYPGGIGPTELWRYLTPPEAPVFGRCHGFWEGVGASCPDGDLPAHLDILAASRRDYQRRFTLWSLEEVPLRLLRRSLAPHGSGIEPARLYGWLRLGLSDRWTPYTDHHLALGEAERIGRWLTARPQVQKAVIRHAFEAGDLPDRPAVAYEIHELLYRAAPPDDLGHWHLREAAVAGDIRVAERHVIAYRNESSWRPCANRGVMERARIALAGRPELLRRLEGPWKSDLPGGYLAERRHLLPYERVRADGDTRLLDAARSERGALLENRASPELMHRLATRCFRGNPETAAATPERLRDALFGDEDLYRAALAGLRGAPSRADLPDAASIASGGTDGNGDISGDSLGLAVLAGLSEAVSGGAAPPTDEARVRSAVAFSLVLRSGQSEPWFRRLAEERPQLVAEELRRYGRARLSAGSARLARFSLASDDAYAGVAALASIPLLRSFPPRAAVAQLPLLHELLRTALRHARPPELVSLVEKKTANGSVTRTQRVSWLAAGLVLDSSRYLAPLESEVGGSDRRRRTLLEFFSPPETDGDPVLRLDAVSLAFLVRMFGPRTEPADLLEAPRSGPAALVRRLIAGLGEAGAPEAGGLLAGLASRRDYEPWSKHLLAARERHRVRQRDAAGPAPSVREVVIALRNGAPANADDLRALVLDRIDRIAEQMRTTNANPWKPYWTGYPGAPKTENDCRDALLAALRALLPDGCDAQPEGQYARNRRADIRVAGGSANVPIELKRAKSPDLWTAPGGQLLARYANDPATGGFGIYLVLWHGAEYAPRDPETGRRFADAAALERALREGLDEEERRRVAVRVLDVSPPGAG